MGNRKKNGNGNGHKNGNGNNIGQNQSKSANQPETVAENKIVPLIESGDIIEVVKGNIVTIDSNIAIHQPSFIKEIRVDGNLLVIPWTVLFELNNLKTSELVGYDAREAVRFINEAVDSGAKDLIIETATDFLNLSLDRKKPDHQIIACVNHVLKSTNRKGSVYYGYQKIKFLSDDLVVIIMSKTLFRGKNIIIEPLLRDRVKRVKLPHIRSITLLDSKGIELKDKEFSLPYKAVYRLKENEAVIFISKYDLNKQIDLEELKARFLGIRKGDRVLLVNPGIKIHNLVQAPLPDGKVNWPQVAAIHMLLDREIDLIFLQGAPGSGKTLLALATGLELRKEGQFKSIIVARVTEPIDRSQSIGLLPGGVEAKMAPWVLPIVQNLAVLRPNNATGRNGYDEGNVSVIEAAGISIQPLDFIRGTTFRNTLFIIEEAQNLTPHQIKTLITRPGEGTKMIFTGDLSQIEEGTKLDINSSGLTYAISRMAGQSLVGIVNFQNVVRSRLARLAEKLL